MYLTRTRAKFVSCSWSLTCSKYPVYPRYRVTAIESSTPSGRVDRQRHWQNAFLFIRPKSRTATFDYHDFDLRRRRIEYVICHAVLPPEHLFKNSRRIYIKYIMHFHKNFKSRHYTRLISQKFSIILSLSSLAFHIHIFVLRSDIYKLNRLIRSEIILFCSATGGDLSAS